jgi:selenocysteine-specific elongation factor
LRHLVLGTAGHIDHGKSALVQALTGTDPDRLKEEKRRGITIELGFADLELDAERVLSFVDVPGHERFVRHMVAGAAGIEAVLLVVAADQGVQPQTREHLEICTLLGLDRGVVALSKCDLVDSELQEVAALELRELLQGTFLEHAPLVPVSARTGDGLPELKHELLALFDRPPPDRAVGVPRLPIDRSFVLKGFGTVVTGTLAAGRFRAGEEVEILPRGRRGRVRGLQIHNKKVEAVEPGCRTAMNLQGLETDDVPRGATVSLPGALPTTRRIWVRIRLLPHAPQNLQRGGPVRFHQSTCDRAARYRVVAREADGTLDAELYLREETVLVPGDRFILRRPAPVDTVGGGVVVDVRPPRVKTARPEEFAAAALNPTVALRLRLARAAEAGREPGEVANELGLTLAQLQSELESEPASWEVAGSRWIDAEAWSEVERAVQDRLRQFHREEPLRLGVPREELRARAGGAMIQESWRKLLEGLERQGTIRLEGERVALAGHEVVLAGAEKEAAERIDRRFREGGLDPPEAEQAAAPLSGPGVAKLVELLVVQGKLARIHGGRLFHVQALEELRAKLRDYRGRSKTISVAEFKELAGVTRKNAIPLLEQLDAERTTRRVGNDREILI